MGTIIRPPKALWVLRVKVKGLLTCSRGNWPQLLLQCPTKPHMETKDSRPWLTPGPQSSCDSCHPHIVVQRCTDQQSSLPLISVDRTFGRTSDLITETGRASAWHHLPNTSRGALLCSIVKPVCKTKQAQVGNRYLYPAILFSLYSWDTRPQFLLLESCGLRSCSLGISCSVGIIDMCLKVYKGPCITVRNVLMHRRVF